MLKSNAWKYFVLKKNDNGFAIGNIFNVSISRGKSGDKKSYTTSSLINHLKRIHGINVETEKSATPCPGIGVHASSADKPKNSLFNIYTIVYLVFTLLLVTRNIRYSFTNNRYLFMTLVTLHDKTYLPLFTYLYTTVNYLQLKTQKSK
jgi:hypothetical protein